MGARDSYIWYPAANGSYSTRSDYAAAIAATEITPRNINIPAFFNWFKSIWTISTSPKLQLFFWKIINRALPTGDNLQRRGLMHSTSCVHCGLPETAEHLLFYCDFAKKVWELIPLVMDFNPDGVSSFAIALEAAGPWTCLPPSGVSGDIFSWVCWNLWITRNQLLFEKRPASPQLTVSKALMGAREWIQAQETLPEARRNTQNQARPQSIPEGTVTCNTDAAWKKETSSAGLTWIFDSSTPLIASDGCQFQLRVHSALMAEGLEIREALTHARHLGITKLWIRSDSLSLVKAVNWIAKPMNLHGVLSDIETLSASEASFFFIKFLILLKKKDRH